jgi:O-antigen/teichoic acid export membrane protein
MSIKSIFIKNFKILKVSSIFLILGFVQPLAFFLLFPYFVNNLSTEEFGILSLLNSYVVLVSLVSTLNVSNAFFRYYFEYKDNPEYLDKFYKNTFKSAFLLGLLFILPLILCIWLYFKLGQESFSINLIEHVIPTVLTGLFYGLISIYINYKKAQEKIIEFAVINIVLFLSSLVFPIIAISIFKLGLSGAVIGRFAAVLLAVIPVILISLKKSKYTISPRLSPLYKFSLQSLPQQFLGWLNQFSDRFIIDLLINLSFLGVYSYIITITGILQLFYVSLMSGLQIFLFKSMKNKELKEHSLGLYFHISTILFFGILHLFTSVLPFFLEKEELNLVPEYAHLSLTFYLIGSTVYYISQRFTFDKMNILLNKFLLYYTVCQIILVLILLSTIGTYGVFIGQIISAILYFFLLYSKSSEIGRKSVKRYLFRLVIPLTITSSLLYISFKSNLLNSIQMSVAILLISIALSIKEVLSYNR